MLPERILMGAGKAKIIVGIDLSARRCMKAGDSDQSRAVSRIRLNWLRDSAFTAMRSNRVAALSQKGFSP